MSAITLDESMVKKLSALHESTEIRDASGKVLGVFTPVGEHCCNQKIPQHLLDKFDHSEMERRSKSRERGRTTADVLQRIHDLEKAQ